ncbi:hypothetical protein GCM10010520_36340 [Rhizobium viscosum]
MPNCSCVWRAKRWPDLATTASTPGTDERSILNWLVAMANSFATDCASRRRAGQALRQIRQKRAAVLYPELRQNKEF